MSERLSDLERYVIQRILAAEGHGKTWIGIVCRDVVRAAQYLAERGLVVCGADGRDFLARRASGARIEDLV